MATKSLMKITDTWTLTEMSTLESRWSRLWPTLAKGSVLFAVALAICIMTACSDDADRQRGFYEIFLVFTDNGIWRYLDRSALIEYL